MESIERFDDRASLKKLNSRRLEQQSRFLRVQFFFFSIHQVKFIILNTQFLWPLSITPLTHHCLQGAQTASSPRCASLVNHRNQMKFKILPLIHTATLQVPGVLKCRVGCVSLPPCDACTSYHCVSGTPAARHRSRPTAASTTTPSPCRSAHQSTFLRCFFNVMLMFANAD